MLRFLNRTTPLHLLSTCSPKVSITYTCQRQIASLEARRKRLKTTKRRKQRLELKEGESQIIFSTHDHFDPHEFDVADPVEDTQQKHVHGEINQPLFTDEALSETETATHTEPEAQSTTQSKLHSEGTSNDNQEPKTHKLLPEIRKLIKPTGEYLYGPNAIISALRANRRPFYHRLYVSPIVEQAESEQHVHTLSKRKQNYTEILSLCEQLQIPIEFCSKKELNHFVSKNMHQGFVLDCDAIKFANVEDQALPNASSNSVWIAFDHLFNEENVGAVLRSAFFFGVDGCIYCSKHCAPLSPLVATTSSGALDCMDIRMCSLPLHEYLGMLKQDGWNVIGLDVANNDAYDYCAHDGQQGMNLQMKQERDEEGDKHAKIRRNLSKYKAASKTVPTMIVIGNESKGLSDQVREECSELLYIEGNGNALEYNIDSLNVASACSVALYHIKSDGNF